MEIVDYMPTTFGEAKHTGGAHGYVAYFPNPLPRTLPLTDETLFALMEAEAALGRLGGAGRLLPDPHLLAQAYLRREAVSSTRIEGTQASLSELFEAEASDAPFNDDIREVINYIEAFDYGTERLETLPMSTRLLREMHAIILRGSRGQERLPGEVRSTQNWIGGSGATIASASFVPPPPSEIGPLLDDLEQFLHEIPLMSPIAQAALAHYQFETIHPFLDGNGRLGRLLIVFFLITRDRLPSPLLYLSPYFENDRSAYYDYLQAVRERGEVDQWIRFVADGVRVQATDALTRAERLADLREHTRAQAESQGSAIATRAFELAFHSPILTSKRVEKELQVTKPTALSALSKLEAIGFLFPMAAGPRNQRRWFAKPVLEILAGDN